ncbi:DUF1345 domain-containing protein [Desertihabitans aurantiacus]|uniref:DUF1345 domain-containing protein n=1 Tax=Desertihabitans aurantiacus TaxID=2282477 RepID=UPI000DF81516|nr:DUF1345 domain-containing protein [Desertihabitans aurantiacus]
MRAHGLLRSELNRHTVTTVATTAVVVAGSLANAASGDDVAQVAGRVLAILMIGFGLYGPVFLVLTLLAFRGLTGDAFRSSLRRSDTRHPVLRMLQRGWSMQWAVYVALVSVGAVLALALNAQLRSQPLLIGACLLCVAGNWVLLVTSFAVEYARAWAGGGGFRFPDGDDSARTLGDFFYAAIQVSTTYASSDVELTDRRSRRLVSVHAITGFVFSSVIVALLVSLLLSSG